MAIIKIINHRTLFYTKTAFPYLAATVLGRAVHEKPKHKALDTWLFLCIVRLGGNL